jgi:hypothetical protein
MLELEGTWEEILVHSSELAGQRVRLTVLPAAREEPDWETMTPTERFAASMDLAEAMEREMEYSKPDDSVALVREARAGAIYGYEPAE